MFGRGANRYWRTLAKLNDRKTPEGESSERKYSERAVGVLGQAMEMVDEHTRSFETRILLRTGSQADLGWNAPRRYEHVLLG
jgi:hypothetical protein